MFRQEKVVQDWAESTPDGKHSEETGNEWPVRKRNSIEVESERNEFLMNQKAGTVFSFVVVVISIWHTEGHLGRGTLNWENISIRVGCRQSVGQF